MPKFTATEWDEVRRKFRQSIMVETSLSSLAQNLDTQDWPAKDEDERPSKYIDFTYEELLMMPAIAGKPERADHLIGILKETLAFDDPFGDMVAQVEETAAKENPILKTLQRLGIPADFPLALAHLSEGTCAVCASEGVQTIGEFANLAQQMSTRVVIGGDFRALLNALTHGDEEAIGQFLPYRRGASGLHLIEAAGLAAARLARVDQIALASAYGARLPAAEAGVIKTLSSEAQARLEQTVRAGFAAVFERFADQKKALIAQLVGGAALERLVVGINEPAREAIVVRLLGKELASQIKAAQTAPAVAPAPARRPGFFARLFGRK